MKPFILSDSGRILALAIGVALAGNGAEKLIDGSLGVPVACLADILAIALAVAALGTALAEHFAAAALTVVLLPVFAFLGEVGVGLLPPSGAVPLVIAGFAALAFAARRRHAPEPHPAGFAMVRHT